MIPAAIIIKSSGIPKANRPDNTVLIPEDNPDERTSGMNKGLRKPDIKTAAPQIKRFFGGFFVAGFVSFKLSK